MCRFSRHPFAGSAIIQRMRELPPGNPHAHSWTAGWSGDGIAILFLLLAVLLFDRARRALVRRLPEIQDRVLRCRRAAASNRRVRQWKEIHPGAVAFLRDRLSPGHVLGLHLTLGLAVVALLARLLAELTESVLEGSPLVVVDLWVFSLMGWIRTPLMTEIMEGITRLGGWEAVTAGTLLACLSLVLRRRAAETAGLLAVIVGGSLISLVMKTAVDRPRPPAETMLSPFGASFPSGHTLMAVLFYGFWSYLLVRSVKTTALRSHVVTWTIFLVLMIGLSRMYLGVHYLSDVAAGFAAGACWLAVCVTSVEIYRRQGRQGLS